LGPEILTVEQRRDILEIVEDRYDARSLLIISQIPVKQWYDIIGNPTLAEAILDRIIHNAYRIELSGETLRERIEDSESTMRLALENQDQVNVWCSQAARSLRPPCGARSLAAC